MNKSDKQKRHLTQKTLDDETFELQLNMLQQQMTVKNSRDYMIKVGLLGDSDISFTLTQEKGIERPEPKNTKNYSENYLDNQNANNLYGQDEVDTLEKDNNIASNVGNCSSDVFPLVFNKSYQYEGVYHDEIDQSDIKFNNTLTNHSIVNREEVIHSQEKEEKVNQRLNSVQSSQNQQQPSHYSSASYIADHKDKYKQQQQINSNIDTGLQAKGNKQKASILAQQNHTESDEEMDISVKNKLQNALQPLKKQKTKMLTKFDRGIQIISNLLKQQVNKEMRIQQIIVQFYSFLMHRMSNRKSSSLTQLDIKYIGDKCYFQQDKKKQKESLTQSSHNLQKNQYNYQNIRCLEIAFNFLHHNLRSLSCVRRFSNMAVFMPTNKFIVAWDTFQIIFINIFLYIYSILIFFAQDEKAIFINDLFKGTLFILIVDIILQLNTAYYEKDHIIIKHSKILKKYGLSYLCFTDLICLFVIIYKLQYQLSDNLLNYNPNHELSSYLLNACIFFLANRLPQKQMRFTNIVTFEENQKHIFRLAIQLFNVLLVAHTVAIGWYLLGVVEENLGYSITWLSKANITPNTYSNNYIFSLYWSITTMTTVGYGDISATNSTEALFILICMIMFSCVFAYSVNNIGFILQEIEKSSKQLNDNLTIIQRYFNRKNVNISIKSRVTHYLRFLAEEQKNRDKQQEDLILSNLPFQLRQEIADEINTRIISKFPQFCSNFSSSLLKKAIYIMEEVLVAPNEVLFQENEADDQSIYFIQSGIIEIFSEEIKGKNKESLVLQQLSSNQIFGEISFFSGLARTASARSVNLSTLYKISRERFICLLKENSEEFERFKMLEEEIVLNRNLKCIFVQCYNCKLFGHILKNCPKTHCYFDRQFIVLRNNYSTFQERKYVNSRRKRRLSFRKLLSQNKKICKMLKEKIENFSSLTKLQYSMVESHYIKRQKSNEEDEEEEEEEENEGEENCESQSNISHTESENSCSVSMQLNNSNINNNTKIQKPSLRDLANINSQRKFSAQLQQEKDIFMKENTNSLLKIESAHNIQKQQIRLSNKDIVEGSLVREQSSLFNKSALQQDTESDKIHQSHIDQIISKMRSDLNNHNQISQFSGLDLQEQITNSPQEKDKLQKVGAENSDELMKEQNKKKGRSKRSIDTGVKKQIFKKQNIYSKNLIEDSPIMSNSPNTKKNQDSYLTPSNQNIEAKIKSSINNLDEYNKNVISENSYLQIFNTTKQHQFDQKILNILGKQLSIEQQIARQSLLAINQQVDNLLMLQQNEPQNEQKAQQKPIHSNSIGIQFQQTSNVDKPYKNLGNLTKLLQNYKQLEACINADQEDQQGIVRYEKFEVMKEFKKFFPNFNYNKVISQANSQLRTQRKKKHNSLKQKRRSNVLCLQVDSSSNAIQNIQNISTQIKTKIVNHNEYMPTFLSYGVSKRGENIYPLKHN